MKTKTSLLLAGLVALTATANADQSPADSNVVVLPTYVVQASRQSPAEQKITASLNELRQEAKAPVYFATELPLLQGYFAQQAEAARAVAGTRIAKS
jgi:hypothetical protein